jgi:YfiH family protein
MIACPEEWIRPDWPVPGHVRALITTRVGGVSTGPYGAPPHGRDGMNLGFGSGDDPDLVRQNRARLLRFLPSEPRWLKQVHGAGVVSAERIAAPVEADASIASSAGVVAAVMIADCMPVLLADPAGRCVGVAHAGWRGLAAGVIQATATAMRQRLGDPAAELFAYLGPAIGPAHFEVGPEVLAAMEHSLPDASTAFSARGAKYLADLFALGRQALAQVGVSRIHGRCECTYSDSRRYYSFRRDRVTGRHAAMIWLERV